MRRPAGSAGRGSDAGPAAVAHGLLTGLANAEDAGAAASVLATVAHARFLAQVGGERHLARLLTNAAYAPLVAHVRAEPDPPQRLDDAARITFTVVAADGRAADYLLSMVRAVATPAPEGPSAATWRVTGLVRRELTGL